MTDLRGIQRYDIEFTAQASHSEYRDMVEGELGDWVKYDDVAEALSSSEALVKELAKLALDQFKHVEMKEYALACAEDGYPSELRELRELVFRTTELLKHPEIRRILEGK